MDDVKISNIAKELDKLCKERNISRYALARKAGMHDSSVRNMFQRGTTPSFYNLEKMCKGLGITVAQFFAQSELFEKFTDDQREMLELFTKADEKSRKLMLLYARTLIEASQREYEANEEQRRMDEINKDEEG